MSNIDSTASGNREVYARVTAQIATAIENAIGSWRMPWHNSGIFAFSPVNTTSKKPYRGINIVGLWAAPCQSSDRDGLVTPLDMPSNRWNNTPHGRANEGRENPNGNRPI